MDTSEELKDLTYTINVYDDGRKEYFLNKQPWNFVDPSQVKVGDIVYFDPNGLNRYGIVTGIREGDFIYYDVSPGDKVDLEEVAMFQVYKVG